MLHEIQIFIASADTTFQSGLSQVLEEQPHLRVLGKQTSGKHALSAIRNLEPDVLLVDFVLEDMSGLDVLRQLDSTKPPRTILLGEELDIYDQTQAALWGASGAIRKTESVSTLFKCIRSVLSGELWFSRSVMKALSERTHSLNPLGVPDRGLVERLTKRELDVLGGVAQGMSNQEISTSLQISQSTTKHHLTRIFSKLRVSSRLELALLGAKCGLQTKREAMA